MPDEPRPTTHAEGDAVATTQPGGTATPTQDTIVPANCREDGSVRVILPAPGYDIGEVIGKGGMGEVVAAHDRRINRDVAIKRMRGEQPNATQVSRFLREARIQARLDHPAIVPVYELGTDEDGKPFFTMKRLAGTTLAQCLAEKQPVPKLLRALVDVCLAIELAHSRGVIHRDLKPANIMLGDYGEVYVLDWGVARVLADAATPRQDDIATLDGATSAGAILGTPGYMAPEQIQGTEIGPPADIYALGAMLFEILTGQPLHPRGEGALGSTLTSPQQAPAKRAPQRQIAPELDAVCHEALAEDPKDRPTARGLADRVQRYLDGDRDVERRRALAAEHLVTARTAFESGAPDARETAIRHAGHAVVLDPESEEAAGVVNALVFETPTVYPPALQAALDAAERAFERKRLFRAIFAYVGLLASWAVIPFLDVVNWTVMLMFNGIVVIGGLYTYLSYRTGRHSLATSFVINMLLILGYARILGPFMITPTLIAGAILTLAATRTLATRPWILTAWVAVAATLPTILERTGVLPRTWWVTDGHLVTTSGIFALHGRVDEITLIVVNTVFQCIVCVLALSSSRARWDSERAQLIQGWHLKQMLPAGARAWPSPAARKPA